MLPPVPYLSNEEIRREADLFLDRYHPTAEIPVPIEDIIELNLGIEILPEYGLRQRFGIDGFITADLQTITVDAILITRYVNRYRFTDPSQIDEFNVTVNFKIDGAPGDMGPAAWPPPPPPPPPPPQ